MKGTTHLASGLAGSVYFAPAIVDYAGSIGVSAPYSSLLIVCGMLIGSLLPDIDTP